MADDEKFMYRAIELAKCGLGNVAPNPLVGAVLVVDDEIIGEGFHEQYGKAHAEVNAIASVEDVKLLKKATLYVTLEPCSHYGKTPPCSNLIIEKQIPKVVIGHTDPFPQVAGRGVKKLKDAGVEVITDVLKEKCYELNKRFFTFYEKKRPYYILKWAETVNGYMAPKNHTEKSYWISNSLSKNLSHKWRAEEQAILVGKNTVLKDNPRLNVRNWKGNNPCRIVIDKNLDISGDYYIYDDSQKTLIINSKKNEEYSKNTRLVQIDFHNFFKTFHETLIEEKIQSVIVEGGLYTLQNFIDNGMWDEIRIFKSPVSFSSGLKAPQPPSGKTVIENIGDNLLITIYKDDLSAS